jgi:hypothetical protein
MKKEFLLPAISLIALVIGVSSFKHSLVIKQKASHAGVLLVPVKKFVFNSFVDCNMFEV